MKVGTGQPFKDLHAVTHIYSSPCHVPDTAEHLCHGLVAPADMAREAEAVFFYFYRMSHLDKQWG